MDAEILPEKEVKLSDYIRLFCVMTSGRIDIDECKSWSC